MDINIPSTDKPRIVVIGGGFAGIEFINKAVKQDVQIVLLDRNNYHTFQPLLYQVATGGLEPDSIAYPFRRVYKDSKNFFFRVAEVIKVNFDLKRIRTSIGTLSFDYLVIASGSKSNYYNLEKDKHNFMAMKTVPHALDLRSLLFQNFEKALLVGEGEEREALMNIVIVGAGPTGVELAGALGEMKKFILPKDYKELDLQKMKIYLFEMADKVLPTMSADSSRKAQKYLEKLDVNILLNATVEGYDGRYVQSEGHYIPTETFIWTAGVQGNIINGIPEEVIGKANRIKVDRYNKVLGTEGVFVIGDLALMSTHKFPNGHPMLAPVAIQQGKLLAENISRILKNKPLKKFEYKDKGSMATVGRNKAVADLPNMQFGGFIAWFLWLVVHIFQLIGFRNKLVVIIGWVWNYFTYDRALRLIIRPFRKKKNSVPI